MGNKFKMWLFLLIFHCFLDFSINLPLNQTDLIKNEDLKALDKIVINDPIITKNKTEILLTTTAAETTTAKILEESNSEKNENDIIISNSRNLELVDDSQKEIKTLGNEDEGNLIEYRESESKSDDMDEEIRNALNIEKETAIESAASEALDDIPDPEVRKTFIDELLDIDYPKNIRQEDLDKKEPESSLIAVSVKPEVDEGTINPDHVEMKEFSVESSSISNTDKSDNETTITPILSHKIEEIKTGIYGQDNDKDSGSELKIKFDSFSNNDEPSFIATTTIIPQTEINARDGKTFKDLNEEESDEVPYEFPIKSRRKIYTENHSDTDFATKLNQSNFGKSLQVNEKMLNGDHIQAEPLIGKVNLVEENPIEEIDDNLVIEDVVGQKEELTETGQVTDVNSFKESEDLNVDFTTLASYKEIPKQIFEELQPINKTNENQTEESIDDLEPEVIEEFNNTVVDNRDQSNSDMGLKNIEMNETNETGNRSTLQQSTNDLSESVRKSEKLNKEIANNPIIGKSFLNEVISEDENRGAEDYSDVNDSAIDINTEITFNDTNLNILNSEEERATEKTDEDDTTMSSDTRTDIVIISGNNDISIIKNVLASGEVTTLSPLNQIETTTVELNSKNPKKKEVELKENFNRKFDPKKEELENKIFDKNLESKNIEETEATTTEENNMNTFETSTSISITNSVNFKKEKIKESLNNDSDSSSSSEEDKVGKMKKNEKHENKILKNTNKKFDKKNKEKKSKDDDSSEANKEEKNYEKENEMKVLKVYDLLNEANNIKKKDFDDVIPPELSKSISLETVTNNNKKDEINLEAKPIHSKEFDKTSMSSNSSLKVLIPSSKENTHLPLLTFETTTVLPRKVFREALNYDNDNQILEEMEIPVDADILNEIVRDSDNPIMNIGRALPNQGVPKESNASNSAFMYLLLSTAIVLIIGILMGTFYKYRGRQGTLNIELEERVNGKNDNIDDLQEVSISPSESELSQTNSLLPPSDGTENTSANATTSLLSESQNSSNDISHNDNSSD